MFHHQQLGDNDEVRRLKLARLIRAGEIALGGYSKGKIFGSLHCSSGKRMRIENRVFFKDKNEAINHGYRPCGHCLPDDYRRWRNENRATEVSN